jgi:hypothetical protein
VDREKKENREQRAGPKKEEKEQTYSGNNNSANRGGGGGSQSVESYTGVSMGDKRNSGEVGTKPVIRNIRIEIPQKHICNA